MSCRRQDGEENEMKGKTMALALSAGAFMWSCASSSPPAPQPPPQPQARAAGPNWEWLDSGCQSWPNFDAQRCPLVKAVLRMTDTKFAGLPPAQIASAYVRGETFSTGTSANTLADLCRKGYQRQCLEAGVTQIRTDLGGPADFLAKADAFCAERYERACVAATVVRIEQKLVEAERKETRSREVQKEVVLARKALALDAQDRETEHPMGRPTTGALDDADGYLDAALAEVRREEEAEASAKATQDAAKAALAECAADPGKCQAECKADVASDSCWRLATVMGQGNTGAFKNGPDFKGAKSTAQRNCEAGNKYGCLVAMDIDKAVDAAWSSVATVVDDIARKVFMTENAQKLAPTQPLLRRDLPTMVALNRKQVVEQYCPVKAEFMLHAGAVEFQKRSASHCKDDPPVGTGISGADVMLTTQCQAVFATACR